MLIDLRLHTVDQLFFGFGNVVWPIHSGIRKPIPDSLLTFLHVAIQSILKLSNLLQFDVSLVIIQWCHQIGSEQARKIGSASCTSRNHADILISHEYTYILQQGIGLLIGKLASPSALFQCIRRTIAPSLVVTSNDAGKGLAGHFADEVAFNVVQHSAGFSLHTGIQCVGLSLDRCVGHCDWVLVVVG